MSLFFICGFVSAAKFLPEKKLKKKDAVSRILLLVFPWSGWNVGLMVVYFAVQPQNLMYIHAQIPHKSLGLFWLFLGLECNFIAMALFVVILVWIFLLVVFTHSINGWLQRLR
jgi:hypothetical protein